MKKSLFTLALAAVLTLSVFAACTPTPHVGVDSSALEPFVIGGIGPLTEDRAQYGLSVRNGAQIAVNEINATGGVNGFRLVLNFQDSQGDPATALSVYQKLLDNDMKVLLGGVFSQETEALLPALVQDGLLTLTPTASRVTAIGESGTVFRVCFDDARLGSMSANFIADYRLASHVAVVYSDTVYGGKEQADAFLAAWQTKGTADVYRVSSEGPRDFSVIVNDLKKKQTKFLFLALSPEESKLFLTQFEWDGITSDVKILGASGLEGLLEQSQAPTMLEGMFVATTFAADSESALVQNFVTSYQAEYETLPDRYAADAYDAVYAIAEAIKRAGITPENVDNDDFNRKIISAMTKIEVNGLTGTMSWTANGETTRAATVKIIRNGKYQTFSRDGA